MLAMLMAQRIMLGKMTYAEVPDSFKEDVAEILTESGREDLITE